MTGELEQRLAVVAAVTRAFSQASLSLDELFATIVERLATTIGDSCALQLLDPSGTRLVPVAYHHPDPETRRLADQLGHAPLVVAEHRLVRAVIETGEPYAARLAVEELARPHTTLEYEMFVKKTGVHSVMMIPLRARGVMLGALTLLRHRATPRPYDHSELELAVLLADHAALAVDNARAYTALSESKRVHQQFIETSPVPMFAFDLETYRIVDANDACIRLYGYAREELIGRHLDEIRAPGSLGIAALVAELGSDSAQTRATHVRRDGTLLEVEGTSHTSTYDGRKVRFCVITDVSALATAGRERRRAQERFDRLAGAGIIGILIADLDGRILEVNDPIVEMFGYSREELLDPAFRWSNLPAPEWQAEHRAKIERLRSAGVVQPREREYIRKDGRRMPVLTGAAVLEDDAQVICFVLDLAGQAWAEAAIEHLREARVSEARFQQANRELEAFSYSVAHDLRAPLRAMNGFANLLVETYADRLDDEGRDWLGHIRRNALRMGQLIDALLSLAQLSRSELRPEPIDLGGIAQELIRGLAEAEPARAFELVVASPIVVEMDPALARVLVANLVGNAWKFTANAKHARIEVGALEVDGEPACFVRDNGAGFDMTYANKLFAPFQRLHAANEYPGTGIGLATVQRIVHRHGGRAWAQARVGEGATFYFSIPPAETR